MGNNGGFERQYDSFLKKITILLSYGPAVMLTVVYPREMKTYFHSKPCTWMFIAAYSQSPELGANQDMPQ